MVTKANPTLLVIAAIGIPPYSARGLKQTLGHIGQASQNKRTVNGNLKDVSFDGFKKYKSTITGADQMSPAFAGVWPGMQVTVDCIQELSYKTVGGAPGRTVVPDSSRVVGDFTYFRPRLTMRVVSYDTDIQEWTADTGWSLELEEI